MHMTARRIRGGQALRNAMDAYGGGAGITLKALHEKTVLLDPAGKGVSLSLIGFLVRPSSAGVSGSGPNRTRRSRETTSPETATLLEQALDARPGELFTREYVSDPADAAPGVPPQVPEVLRGLVPEARFRDAG